MVQDGHISIRRGRVCAYVYSKRLREKKMKEIFVWIRKKREETKQAAGNNIIIIKITVTYIKRNRSREREIKGNKSRERDQKK